jgi:flagella basal body P-ring formation protein FlgA
MSRLWVILIMLLTSEVLGIGAAVAGPSGESRSVSPVSRGPIHRDDVVVERAAVSEVNPDLIRKAIQRHLEHEWGRKVKTVHVTVLEPADPVMVPGGTVELHIVPGPADEAWDGAYFTWMRRPMGKFGRPSRWWPILRR